MTNSIETEIRLELKNKAEEGAIKIFSLNLENLLLLPPIPGKVVLGMTQVSEQGLNLLWYLKQVSCLLTKRSILSSTNSIIKNL